MIEGLPDNARNVNILLKAMNSIMDFLNFTEELPSDFPDLIMPTLDYNLFISDGKIADSFIEKPMKSDKCIDAKTALPDIIVKSSLRQEIVHRLIDMHLDLPIFEKPSTLDSFYDKMRISGHSHDQIMSLFVEALLKFQQMVKNSQLDHNDPKFKLLYLANDYNKVGRGIHKVLKLFDWFDPSNGAVLLKSLQQIKLMLVRLSGYAVRLIE